MFSLGTSGILVLHWGVIPLELKFPFGWKFFDTPELDSLFMDSPSFAKDKRRIHFTCLLTGFHRRSAADACVRGVTANWVESIDGYTSGGKISIESVRFSCFCDHLIINLFIFTCWNKIGRSHVISFFFNLNEFKVVAHIYLFNMQKFYRLNFYFYGSSALLSFFNCLFEIKF